MTAYSLTLSREVQAVCSPEEQAALRGHPEFLKLAALVAECEAKNGLLGVAKKAKEAAYWRWRDAESVGYDPTPHRELTKYQWSRDEREQEEKKNLLRRRVTTLLAGGEALAKPDFAAAPTNDPRLAELEHVAEQEINKRRAAAAAELAASEAADAAYREAELARDAMDNNLSEAWYGSPIKDFVTLHVDHW